MAHTNESTIGTNIEAIDVLDVNSVALPLSIITIASTSSFLVFVKKDNCLPTQFDRPDSFKKLNNHRNSLNKTKNYFETISQYKSTTK
jgi:hypothetical protein